MTRKHKKHDVVDVEENRKEELETSLNSAIENVSIKKEKIASTQIPVDRKNNECLETLRDEKNKTLDMVRDKYDSMIRQATNQKEESRHEMMSLEENLTLLNNVKVHVDEETLSPGDVKSYQETLDSIKQHTEQIPSEPRVNVYMEYMYLTDKEWLIGQLCGKLQLRNHSADRQTQNLFGMPVQPFTFQPPAFSFGSCTGLAGLGAPAQQPSASGGFTLGTPQDQSARAVDETTQATSLAETEEASASTSPPTDQVEGASSVQQSGSISEGDGEPALNASGGIEEITGALSATSLVEKEANASTSSQNDQVSLPKFERKFSLILRFWVLMVRERA